MEIEASGWKGDRGTAMASSLATRRFYEEIAGWAARTGMLRLAFLRLDGHPLAFHLDLEHDGVLYHLKGGYDEAFARYSPGKVLHAALLEGAFESGLRRYELLGASEDYKLRWATGSEPRYLVQAFAGGARGYGGWLTHAVGRPLAKRALAVVRR
jgi:CelD/BcsL family acetyltransferase involved in cellulose biosynthesis